MYHRSIQSKQSGFTLIELMIVIAIVGILSAIAMPTYFNYMVRSKLAEPMAHMAEMKGQISEYYAVRGKLPNIEELDTFSAIIERLFSRSDLAYVQTINSDITVAVAYFPDYDLSGNPFIIAVIKDEVFPDNQSRRILLRGEFEQTGNTISWSCEYFPDDFVGHTRYLPAQCRNPYVSRFS